MSFITLIRPANVSSRTAYSVPTTPPIGVAYLAATLRRSGHGVQVIDALGEAPLHTGTTAHAKLVYHGLSNDEIVDRIVPETSGIGISAMFSQEWLHTAELIDAVRARFPNAPICVGGEHATAAWTHVLATCPSVDCCALGEGDDTILDFARFVDGELRLDEIRGIAYRRAGQVTCTPPRERIRALDALPWPAWDLTPIENYLDGGYGHGVNLGRSMPVLGTRGCPYSCTFCSNHSMWGARYAVRDVNDVLDEIEYYVRTYRATNIDFYDLTAILKKDWVLAFCAGLERRQLKITWQLPSGTRSEALTSEVLAALHRTGCRNVAYAPESGSAKTLQRIKKRVTLPRMIESIRAAKRVGMNVKCNLILGFPHDSRGDAWKTIGFAYRLAWIGIEDCGVYIYSPYPGSELYDELRAADRVPPLGAEYFASLACFTDLQTSSSACTHIGPRELNMYRLLGMGGFYALSFLLRPWRAVRTAWNVWHGRSRTVLEQRLSEWKQRASVPDEPLQTTRPPRRLFVSPPKSNLDERPAPSVNTAEVQGEFARVMSGE